MRSVVLCAAVVAAFTAAVSDSRGGASLATSENGRIAFEALVVAHDGSARPEIWTMNQDGSDPRRIGRGRDPAWSPDGSRIMFVSADNEIVLSADGGEPRVVEILGLRPDVPVANPALSPDGATIAFGNEGGLYVAPSRGGMARLLAEGSWAVGPSWSPDGRRIAFLEPGSATYRRRGSGREHGLALRGAER